MKTLKNSPEGTANNDEKSTLDSKDKKQQDHAGLETCNECTESDSSHYSIGGDNGL